jgi:hypothetical protein
MPAFRRNGRTRQTTHPIEQVGMRLPSNLGGQHLSILTPLHSQACHAVDLATRIDSGFALSAYSRASIASFRSVPHWYRPKSPVARITR